jgi:hypothetical protein
VVTGAYTEAFAADAHRLGAAAVLSKEAILNSDLEHAIAARL